jgi:hypothetical protein
VARWGSFVVYSMMLDLLCATNRVTVSYEPNPANGRGGPRPGAARRGGSSGGRSPREGVENLAYRSGSSKENPAERGVFSAAERRSEEGQHAEVGFAALEKRILGRDVTPAGIGAKLTAHAYGRLRQSPLGSAAGADG